MTRPNCPNQSILPEPILPPTTPGPTHLTSSRRTPTTPRHKLPTPEITSWKHAGVDPCPTVEFLGKAETPKKPPLGIKKTRLPCSEHRSMVRIEPRGPHIAALCHLPHVLH